MITSKIFARLYRGAILGLIVLSFSTVPLSAEPTKIELKVEAGKFPRKNVPVRVPVNIGPKESSADVVLADPKGERLVGQLCHPNLLATGGNKTDGPKGELCFILPSLAAGETATFTATVDVDSAKQPPAERFQWKETPGESSLLSFGDRPVIKFQCKTYQPKTPAEREETFKVFHHVYDPTGKFVVTNGPGGYAANHGKIQFPHHRGIFYGFKKVVYDGNKEVDIWHCTGDTHQAHSANLQSEAGPVVGRHRVEIDWCGKNNDVFATEPRELAVYNTPGGTLIEFCSRLTPTKGPIHLDGDPQHAGFHFRAHNDVNDKTAKQTYYLRPDGKGNQNETRNWPDLKTHVNLPWDCASFVLNEQRFSVAYLDRPSNPKEARFSERNYGRFGSYFVADVKPEAPLDVGYRLWLQSGEMTVEQVDALDNDWVHPVQVTAKYFP